MIKESIEIYFRLTSILQRKKKISTAVVIVSQGSSGLPKLTTTWNMDTINNTKDNSTAADDMISSTIIVIKKKKIPTSPSIDRIILK